MKSAALCPMLERTMPLWTAIADYRGGTYISQVRAANVGQAIICWAQAFPRMKGSYVGAKTKTKFLAAVRDPQEKPTRIQRTQDVWYWSPLSIRPEIVVHLVKTAPK